MKRPYSDSEKRLHYIFGYTFYSLQYALNNEREKHQEKRKLPYIDLAITVSGTLSSMKPYWRHTP